MQKLVLAVATVLAIAAFAGTAPALSGGPLDQQSGFLCRVLDADGNEHITSTSYWIVFSSGRAYLTCTAEGSNSSGKKFNQVGFGCGGVDGRVTFDTKVRHSADGTSVLNCHFAAGGAVLTARASGTPGMG